MVRPDDPNSDPRVHDEEDVYEHPPPPPPPPPPVDEAYEQHQPPPPQQGFGIPMQQQQAPPVVVHIHNNINGVPNDGGYGHPPPPAPPMAPHPQYPPPLLLPPPPPRPCYPQFWETGLFDCLDDPENAIITLFCPCVTFGQVAAAIDNGTSCESSGCIYTCVALIIGLPCIISCTYRSRLRGRFGLVEEPLSDCMTHLCCECCALCQEYRELNHRGINPSAGWMKIGNNQNMNQQQPMNPPPGQYMR